MKLGIDAREIQNGMDSGTSHPLAHFINYFASQQNDDQCILFSSEKISSDFGPRVKNVVLKKRVSFLWEQLSLPKAIRTEKIDVFYSPNYKVPLSSPCRTISAIPDIMPLAFEPYRSNMSLFGSVYHNILGKKFARRADQILTTSEYSKKDISRIYGIPEGKIRVIALSVSDIYKAENNFFVVDAAKKFWGIKGRYLLYMGNFNLHENAECIVEAYNFLALKFPDLQLVLAGPKINYYDSLVNRIHQLELTNRVVFPGKISPSEKPHVLYSAAEVFVFPSLYEGFALAPVEAMACGVPVVSSNTTSVPEAVRDAGLLVDPLDVAAVASAIEKILNDADLRKKLIDKGLEYVKEYDAQKISRKMYDFFVEQSRM